MLRVLRELKFPETFYSDRMIEVWNKMDLVEEKMESPEGVLQISALKGWGIPYLLQEVEQKSNKVLNLGTYRFKYGI